MSSIQAKFAGESYRERKALINRIDMDNQDEPLLT